MPDQPIMYQVDYYYNDETVASRYTQFLPVEGMAIQFSADGDTETAMLFYVEDVMVVVPEQDGEVFDVSVNLMGHPLS